MNISADPVTIMLDSVDMTRALGVAIAGVLRPGDVIALEGELGAGKTEFVRAVAVALGVDERDVASPTFVYMNVYEADMKVYHFDAYRLSSAEEFMDIGAREYFSAGGVSFVEWSERVAEGLPADHLKVSLFHGDSPNKRKAVLKGMGEWSRRIAFKADPAASFG